MQKIGLNRNTIDKYYTKSEVVNNCIDIIKNKININKNDIIIEPSAGNGAFNKIKELSNNCYFYDIEPENTDIIKQDFLTLDININININNNNIHIIGNPPFGRQSSIAIKFIKKCCSFASTISFILPRSFKKDSMKKHFLKNYHLITEVDINNAFLVNNIEYDVPCVFQIWEYRDEERIEPTKLEPINFKFVEKEDKPDISFRRIGVNAGTISKDINNKSVQSHYFIKFTNNNIDKLKDIKFENNNTVGPKSISKQELIKEFNKFLI
uniref:Ribosomal RNA adenine methylase transferase N-terminal domain-containing protein n=1 Tax=viral metagenome TaxID=1070528 RepID=A0A6C0HVM9_9ZZZZ